MHLKHVNWKIAVETKSDGNLLVYPDLLSKALMFTSAIVNALSQKSSTNNSGYGTKFMLNKCTNFVYYQKHIKCGLIYKLQMLS